MTYVKQISLDLKCSDCNNCIHRKDLQCHHCLNIVGGNVENTLPPSSHGKIIKIYELVMDGSLSLAELDISKANDLESPNEFLLRF